MKIALVVPGGVDRSGTQRVIPCLLWLIERLAQTDEIHVFALDQEEQPGEWDLLGARIHNAGARPRRLHALAQLVSEHRRGRFDLVHAWWAAGPGMVAAMFRQLTRVPYVLTLPGGDLTALPEIGYGGRLNRRGRLWTRVAIAASRHIIVPSEWMKAQAAALGIEAVRIPLGVAIDRWPASPPRRRTASGPLRLIHVANLNPVKDQETLLLALAELRDSAIDFRMEIVGQDTLRGTVQRRSHELGLIRHVRFHGFMSHAATRPFVEQADLMVMSSRHETVPMVLPEAAIAGVPTVGTAVGQIADWSPDAARAVGVGDYRALAQAIIDLGRNENRRLEVAHEAQRRALAEDAEVTASLIRGLYCGVLESR